jgi:hypothetical protein
MLMVEELTDSLSVTRGGTGKSLARLDGRSTARVSMENLLPAFAVIPKSFFARIENKSYALPVIAIEAVKIQKVTEVWRASGVHFILIQSS